MLEQRSTTPSRLIILLMDLNSRKHQTYRGAGAPQDVKLGRWVRVRHCSPTENFKPGPDLETLRIDRPQDSCVVHGQGEVGIAQS